MVSRPCFWSVLSDIIIISNHNIDNNNCNNNNGNCEKVKIVRQRPWKSSFMEIDNIQTGTF